MLCNMLTSVLNLNPQGVRDQLCVTKETMFGLSSGSFYPKREVVVGHQRHSQERKAEFSSQEEVE